MPVKALSHLWTNQMRSLAVEAKTKAHMVHRIVEAILATMGGGDSIPCVKVVRSHQCPVEASLRR